MNIAIVGTGYVGLVSGACFAEMGIDVTCIDTDKGKIDALQEGVVPIYEPGLEEIVRKNSKAGRLHFTTRLETVLDRTEVIFSAVGTPSDEDGSADLSHVIEVARTVGKNMNRYLVFVTKSTVPVGTSKKIKAVIEEELCKRELNVEFDVASNPEFLKEGAAIEDFMKPERVVIGVESIRAKSIMTKLYKPFTLIGDRLIFTDIASAEMIKYAANSMLATRISFMNDIANLCELVGADVDQVRKGIGSDSRIGAKFLYPGCGYGGSCFPKDVKALIKTAEENGYSMQVLKAVEVVNERQKTVLFDKLNAYYEGKLNGKVVSLLGLAFKPETDDMREAPSLVLISRLLQSGCEVKVYDPVAMEECHRRIGNEVTYCNDMYQAVEKSDAMLLVTEWKEFRMPDWNRIKQQMHIPLVIDGRNIFEAEELKNKGFDYYRIG